jgi:hypothetical protein
VPIKARIKAKRMQTTRKRKYHIRKITNAIMESENIHFAMYGN